MIKISFDFVDNNAIRDENHLPLVAPVSVQLQTSYADHSNLSWFDLLPSSIACSPPSSDSSRPAVTKSENCSNKEFIHELLL